MAHFLWTMLFPPLSLQHQNLNITIIAVGFKDIYDFNALPWGERELEAELLTRAMSVLGSLYEAAEYSITFGIYN